MKSHILSSNSSARCLLKWAAVAVNQAKVTEALKERVTRIECFGDVSGFEMRMVVKGSAAKSDLEISHSELEGALAKGFMEQSGIEMKKLSITSE